MTYSGYNNYSYNGSFKKILTGEDGRLHQLHQLVNLHQEFSCHLYVPAELWLRKHTHTDTHTQTHTHIGKQKS